MRHLLAILLLTGAAGLRGQPAPQEAKPAEQAKPAGEQKGAAPAEAKPAEQAPAPAKERALTGSVDFGNRWLLNRQGDFNTYRSVVNLGEGPKLFGLDLTFQPLTPSRMLDRLDVRAGSWGGEPYNTAGVEARKEGLYRLNFGYKNIAYYNFLPSFADPLQERGIVLNERAFDTFLRSSDFQLDLFPGRRIIPYFAYSRDSRRGSGITNLVLQANEYPVHNRLDDFTNNYRGGVRLEFNRWHLTLEQGGLTYEDNQSTSYRQQAPNLGNLAGSPFFGQALVLNSGDQSYRVTADSIYTRAMITASPFPGIDLYGQFLFSQPHSNTVFSQNNAGNFFTFATLGFYTSQLQSLSAEARQPHPGGSFSIVIGAHRRLRLMQSFLIDELHNATSALIADNLVGAGGSPLPPISTAAADRLKVSYNQQDFNVLFDVTSKLTLRGGWRSVWGAAHVPPALVAGNLSEELGSLRRHVGLAGATFRWGQKLSANVDYEGSPGNRAYFRTSLNEYQKARIRARYQPVDSLLFAANFTVLHNQNPSPDVRFELMNRDNSLSVNWLPGGGKRVSVLAEYSRSTLRSDIIYRIPQTLDLDFSHYTDRANTGTALVDLTFPGKGAFAPKLSFGGSFFKSSGSRPSQYYQPLARFALPFGAHVNWYAEWRWYALSQSLYLYEGFRSNQFITGFRLKM